MRETTLVRLSKVMSERGLCSRREADYYIERGWVEVDGEVISQLGYKINPDQNIKLTRSARRRQSSRLTVLLNKPLGIVSGQSEDGYQPAITLINAKSYYPTEGRDKPPKLGGMRQFAPAGRLDIDSQGLLVLTQDGRIARHLIAPDTDIEKEYRIQVEGDITDDRIQKLRHGLSLDGRKLKPAFVERIRAPNGLTIILREGRKRQIRRMCEQVDLKVTSLRRVRIGGVRLGRLPRGRWRVLGPDESF